MYRKAKLKSTGEIIDVRTSMDHDGNTTWLEDATNTEYYPSELDFNYIPPIRGVLNPVRGTSPFGPDDLVSCTPMQMVYDKVNHIGRIEQTLHIRMTQAVIENALRMATDKQLQDELKYRVNLRKTMRGEILRCKDCKHCIQGYTTKSAMARGTQTSVCELYPKDKVGKGCFYATLMSKRACDLFERKSVDD